MHEEAQAYYRELGREYPTRIRQLVPAYDEMMETLPALLSHVIEGGDGAAEAPFVLDLGIGEGTLALRVLETLPGVRLTGVDASAPMLEKARRRLADHLDRTELLEADLAALDPPGPLAAAYSSLTLHNLARPEKVGLLERLRRRLAPGAALVWADLIRHADAGLQDHFTRRRVEVARQRGCPEDFMAWNFEKEETDDVPLTPAETRELARKAGFGRTSTAWMHNLFAIFVLRE